MPSAPLARTPSDARRLRLDELEARLIDREQALDALKIELQALQSRYLSDIGGLYVELARLEAEVADIEIRRGLRPPPEALDEPDDGDEGGDVEASGGCGNRSAPSSDLKRVFRDLARTIHPDLAMDEPARFRRHSLMAEANRAYAERDEDRLRLILHAWQRSPDAVLGDDPEANSQRIDRRIVEVDDRLIAIETEFADLRTSAICRLKGKIDSAREQGWDLFAEMIQQVRRDISRTQARLTSLRRVDDPMVR
jgi:hypothetical protein